MGKLDKVAQNVLENLYTQFEEKSEITVSSPEFRKTIIDYLINEGLLEKIDASTLSEWAYIIKPTYNGELTFAEILELPSSKVNAFIKQGEVIMKEEYHPVTEPGLLIPDYIDGPKSNQWFSEISIFNDRFLKEHPLHNQIANVCQKHNQLFSAHEIMMGYLKALASDNAFWKVIETPVEPMGVTSRKTIDQMLSDDIKRCEQYLNSPDDEATGQRLYIEITSRYDNIINGFGNGLYQYTAANHFYDPELDNESLKHNIQVLLGKMSSYQASNFPATDAKSSEEKHQILYDVFISHANADKIKYVDQLKQSLEKLSINIFYDKDTLEWGDNWKDKIFEGVGKAEFAIIVISENFFGREWTEKELKEFLNRQNSTGQKIILPILHNITAAQLTKMYPEVADIQALNSKDYSCDEIALKFAGQLIKRLKS